MGHSRKKGGLSAICVSEPKLPGCSSLRPSNSSIASLALRPPSCCICTSAPISTAASTGCRNTRLHVLLLTLEPLPRLHREPPLITPHKDPRPAHVPGKRVHA